MTHKIVLFVNWRKKEGRIHKTTCHHTRKHSRIRDGGFLVDQNWASWWGPYPSYEAAKKIADRLPFKIWDCSQCKPYIESKNTYRTRRLIGILEE